MSDKSRILYPLTSSQREIWFDQMLHADLPLYNIGGYVKISGPVDPQLFEKAANLLVRKHDALGIILQEECDEDGVPLQTFPGELQVSVPVHDFSDAESPHEEALLWMRKRFEQPFTLVGHPCSAMTCSVSQMINGIRYNNIIIWLSTAGVWL